MIVEPRAHFVHDLRRRGLTATDKLALLDFYDDLVAGSLPSHYREHMLRGEWAGYLECHIEEDWLVIYKRLPSRVVLYRTGTHKDLFKAQVRGR